MTEYLGNFQRRTTNARGYATTAAFQAFDTPSEDAPATIWAPESVTVSINRDTLGKPAAITRSGGGKSVTRSYVYDGYERLCKTIEPESGATVQAYDGAGNVQWRASGQGLPGGSCDQGSVPAGSKVSFGYDARDRLVATSYGDGSPGVTRSYWPDGLLQQITTQHPSNPIGWNYSYNNRRLLTRERYTWDSAGGGWNFDWGVDAYGHVSALADPGGTVSYAPNALGEPTQVSGFATGVSYHPNGSIASYTLANGVTHSTTLNTRGLPLRLTNTGISQDAYAYDATGNITAITDEQENVNNRSMPQYDGLDRLRQANGPWGAGSYDYDALDNLVASTVGGRSLTHNIDAGTNRLTSLSGSQSIGIGYDVNGNVTQRGAQSFSFDIGNRMVNAPGKANYYLYDGHGRRNLVWFADGGWMHQAYTKDGKLRFGWRNTEGGTRHVYLGDKLIAEIGDSGVATFSHTDALGSPIAKTNSGGGLVSRTRYEPYGATVAGSTNPTKIGFTGHVSDADTGLVYMQQRYYDPIAGRFLSIDPATTDTGSGSDFNRYSYARSSLYKYTDPDGRYVHILWIASRIAAITAARSAATQVGMAATAVGVLAAANVSNGSVAPQVSAPATAANAASGGKPPEDDESKGSGKSVNQINNDVKKDNAPDGIRRADTGKVKGEQDHVHLQNGNALNRDGSWKHVKSSDGLTRSQESYLRAAGWNLPK